MSKKITILHENKATNTSLSEHYVKCKDGEIIWWVVEFQGGKKYHYDYFNASDHYNKLNGVQKNNFIYI